MLSAETLGNIRRMTTSELIHRIEFENRLLEGAVKHKRKARQFLNGMGFHGERWIMDDYPKPSFNREELIQAICREYNTRMPFCVLSTRTRFLNAVTRYTKLVEKYKAVEKERKEHAVQLKNKD